MSDGPKLGDVWQYPFLWSAEAARGETEGRKQRPVALTMMSQTVDGEIQALFVPVTTKNPGKHPFSLEVPEIERRRAGLDAQIRLWVICDEANTDLPSRSYYFEPDGRLGNFSSPFVKRVQVKMIEALKSRSLRPVARWEPPAD